MFSSSEISFGGVRSLEDPQIWSSEGPQNLVQIIVSQTIVPTLWVSNFYVEQFKNFTLGGQGLAPQIWSKQLAHKQTNTL